MNLSQYVCVLLALPVLVCAAPKKFVSKVISKNTPGHAVDIEIDITGAKQLVLEVADGDDDTGYDWANWIEPRLVGPQGEKRLTDLRWNRAMGRAAVNKNQEGGPLRVNGQPVAYGIGVHAISRLVYKLPPGYTRFIARGGLDNGGVDQANSRPTVKFYAYTSSKDRPVSPLEIELPDGFQAERLYDVDLGSQGSWVVLTVDGKGRLITSDRQGPMYRITLPNENGDDIQVERLAVDVGRANGLLEAFGSLYVVGIGSGEFKGKSGLFRLTDTNQDDQFDKVEHLISLRVGSDHHAHAVILSPDKKRLTILSGNNTDYPDDIGTLNIQAQMEDHLLPRSTYYGHNTGRKAPGGFVLSCLPDGSDRRIICAGFRNPYDIAYNKHGDLFTFDADMEYDVGGPWYRPTRVNHCLSGGEFGWRWGAGKWPDYYPDSVGAVTDIGRGSPTGVVFGYGARFPAKYQEAFYALDWTYGIIYAVHMKPDGASYTGEFEPFVRGRALPVSDAVIHPDGNMYFITGGRRNRSALIRVSYTGSESTAAVDMTPSPNRLNKLRRTLEGFHGKQSPGAVATAWQHLKHQDRAIRYAARTAIEHQPNHEWASRAVKESNPRAAIEAAVAMGRVGSKRHKADLLENLGRINFSSLNREQQLDLLRAYGLIFIRMGDPDPATAGKLARQLSPVFPADDVHLNRELCQMLLYLKAPGAVSRSVKLLTDATTQSDQMFYAYHLRTIREGWTDADLKGYYNWLRYAESHGGDYTGGGHFRNFLKMVRKESTQRLTPEQKTIVDPILAKKPEVEKPVFTPTKIVKEWTVQDLQPSLAQMETARSFIRGKTLYNSLCGTCHLFNGQGGALGPDLSSVGGKYDGTALLTEIIEPSKVISDQHAAVNLTLKDGSELFGREVGGDETTVNLAFNPLDPDDVKIVKKSDIQKRVVSKVSMMPPGMLNFLEEEEILDLLMYLSSGGKVGHTAFQK